MHQFAASSHLGNTTNSNKHKDPYNPDTPSDFKQGMGGTPMPRETRPDGTLNRTPPDCGPCHRRQYRQPITDHALFGGTHHGQDTPDPRTI